MTEQKKPLAVTMDDLNDVDPSVMTDVFDPDEMPFFDEADTDMVARVSMKGDPDGRHQKRMAMHPDEPLYGGLGCNIVAYWENGESTGTWKSYGGNLKKLHNLIGTMIKERKRSHLHGRKATMERIKELRTMKAGDSFIKPEEEKLEQLNKSMVYAFRHTAHGVWKAPADIKAMVSPTRTLQDMVYIRCFESEEEVEALNKKEPILTTQHGHKVKFKWVIV